MNHLVGVLRWIFTVMTESIMNLTKREKRQVMHWLDATRSAENADDIVMEGESGGEEENDAMGGGEGKDVAELKEGAEGGRKLV